MIRKTLAALGLILLPTLTFATAVVWQPVKGAPRSVTGTCASGTCADFAADLTTMGVNLDSVATVRIKVCPAATKKLTGGSVVLWTVDGTAVPAQWMTLTVPAVNVADRCAELNGDSPGLGIPILGSRGRLIPIPAVTVDAGGVTIVVTATGLAGQEL